MKLSVIIPFYDAIGNIAKTIRKGLLQTLENQTLSKNEFEVLIVDDLSPFSVEGIEDLTLDLKVIKLEKNMGVALARQVGISQAKGDYITFIDNDDDLFSKDTLKVMLDNMDPSVKVLSTTILEDTGQTNEKGKRVWLPHTNDKTWMHGKVYDRKFLIDNGIMFKPHLHYCEDAYFNNLAFALAFDKVKFIKETTYLWKWNENSITRRNNQEFNTKYFCDYIKASKTSLNNLKSRNDDRLFFCVVNLAVQSLGYSYYFFQKRDFRKEASRKTPYYKEAIEQFKSFYNQYEGMYDIIGDDLFIQNMNIARNLQSQSAMFIERQTFKQFIKSLGLRSHKVFD